MHSFCCSCCCSLVLLLRPPPSCLSTRIQGVGHLNPKSHTLVPISLGLEICETLPACLLLPPAGPVINRRAASAFYSYMINGCASPPNKEVTPLCRSFAGDICTQNGVHCGPYEVLFHDMTKLPNKEVVVAAGVYASGDLEIRK